MTVGLFLSLAVLATRPVTATVNDRSFTSELCPGEAGVLEVTRSVVLRAEPSRRARLLDSRVSSGESVRYEDCFVRVTKPGQYVASKDTDVQGRSFGHINRLRVQQYYSSGPSKAIRMRAGETLDYLQYRGENTHLIRIGGEVLEVQTDMPGGSLDFVSEPRIELWVAALDDNNKSRGWLLFEGGKTPK